MNNPCCSKRIAALCIASHHCFLRPVPAHRALPHRRDCHLTAATFQPGAPPPSTFTLNGVDYSRDALEQLRQQAAADAAAAGSSRGMPLAQRKLLASYSSKQAPEEGVKAQLRDIASEYWADRHRRQLEEAEGGGGRYKWVHGCCMLPLSVVCVCACKRACHIVPGGTCLRGVVTGVCGAAALLTVVPGRAGSS